MKRMTCPLNGARNIAEFIYGGKVRSNLNPDTSSDREWAGYIFMEENKKGVVREWWMHAPSSYWFIAERDTSTNEIVRTCPAAEVFDVRAVVAKRTTD